MIKHLILVLVFVSIIVTLQAEPYTTEDTRVILFTCGPGEELYAGFGHSALWIFDPVKGIDRLYNYGTFDFNTPHFYAKFIRGKLDYILSVTTARSFLNEYNNRKIEVNGQELNLTHEEVERIFIFLENNLLPENRFYQYDFFYDNCATRIRDVIAGQTGSKVTFNLPDQQLTFREMLFPYLTHTPWTQFGINLILGLASDKRATPWQYQFLPEYMDDAFRTGTIETNGTARPLILSGNSYITCRLDFSNKKADDPAVIFGFLLFTALLIGFLEYKKQKHYKWIDLLIFPLSILAGLFLFFMWVGTDHTATNYNLNILWLFPAQFLFILSMLIKGKVKKILVSSALIYQVLVSLAMFFWPQKMEISFLFLSIILFTRIATTFFRGKTV